MSGSSESLLLSLRTPAGASRVLTPSTGSDSRRGVRNAEADLRRALRLSNWEAS